MMLIEMKIMGFNTKVPIENTLLKVVSRNGDKVIPKMTTLKVFLKEYADALA